jgi:phage terminase large subunit-like protein
MLQFPKITTEDIVDEINRRKQVIFYSFFPDTGPLRRELYPKHTSFFRYGKTHRIRVFRAGNRVGKSIAGGYECVCHLTGIYPSWWTGRRFKRPVNILVAGESGKLTRDSIQLKIMGPAGEIGTGIMPRDCIIEMRAKQGIPDAIDTVRIKHIYGISTLQFQSYDQGREAFQATERDVIWFDEEPPLSVFTEGLTRTMTTKGIVMVTFTPLKGMSETVQFLDKQARMTHSCAVVSATWNDVPHLSESDKKEMLAAYPPHQRDARSQGVPALGSGAIYPVAESDFLIKPFQLPAHYRHIYSMDVGWNNTAAVFAAIDPDSRIVYITGEYKKGQAEPAIHASAIKMRAKGKTQPGVIDPASRNRSQNDGQQLLQMYRELGLNLIPAENAVEAGIYEVWQMLTLGTLKVFSNLALFLDEYRVYRRDDRGKIVKENDHLMDCMRYLVMSGLNLAEMELKQEQKEKAATIGHIRRSQHSWMGV